MKIEYTCKNCGKKFIDYRGNKKVVCSWDCKKDLMRNKKPLPFCEHCKTNRVKRHRSKYCGSSCFGKAKGFKKTGITRFSSLSGKLKKLYPNPEPCVKCGRPGQDKHHPDYNKPLEIVWMCVKCHRKEHAVGYRIKHRPPTIFVKTDDL